MIKLTKDTLMLLVVVVLVVIILLQRSCSGPSVTTGGSNSEPQIKYDTVYKEIKVVEIKRVPWIKRDTTYLPGDTVFVPSKDYPTLKLQYETLAKSYGARNIYRDSVQLDTFGYIVVSDTVQYNKLQNRTYEHNYKIPTVTAQLPPKPRRQLYVGGGISINKSLEFSNVNAGFMYKTKKDQLYGVNVGVDGTLTPYIGVSSYWKISFKK